MRCGAAWALLASVAVAAAAGGEKLRAQPGIVYVTGSLYRTAPDDAPPENAERVIELSAAANEWEAAHLVIRAGEAGLERVDVELTGPPARSDGRTIEARHARFYREHYVRVSNPTDHIGIRGTYPDALIPLRNPFTGERLGTPAYPAAPFDIAPLTNQPVYVEFFVPPGTPAGTYATAVRVTYSGGAVLADIPATLRVWNFELPAETALGTNFQSYDADHSLGAAKYLGYEIGSAQHKAMARAIDELLLEHRLVPEGPMDTALGWDRDGAVRVGAERAARILSYVERPEFTDFLLSFGRAFPFPAPAGADRARATRYLSSAYEWFRSHGLSRKLFLRPGDEPSTDEDFAVIRDLAILSREAAPEIKVAMTVVLTDPRVERYLEGYVRRLVAGYWDFDPARADARIAAGDEIWTYTALVQNERKPSPYWQIDFPLLNYRIPAWINFRYGVTGLLYWTSAYWNQLAQRGESPWANPCNSKSGNVCYNGEGLLVYPGREINLVVPRQAFAPYVSADVYGAAPSLRLKTLRDAVEDYEYLAMASTANGGAAHREAVGVACAGDLSVNCFHHWNESPAALSAARARLAALIESRSPRRGRGEGPRDRLPDHGTRR
ncbi:MAG: DUF4091 domain-containing protein [Bryobacteraceae bacterium]|nr:DUF4091 domain-containing protein [Bryobacteraceae bacterium]